MKNREVERERELVKKKDRKKERKKNSAKENKRMKRKKEKRLCSWRFWRSNMERANVFDQNMKKFTF